MSARGKTRSWVHRSAGAALAAAVVLAVTGGPTTPAHAGTTASITGRVTDAATGEGVAGVRINADQYQYGLWESPGGPPITTAADGSYTVPNLPYGTYRVQAEATQDHVGRWYGAATTLGGAADVAVHEDRVTTGIDIAVPVAAHVTGRISAADTGTGIAQAGVGAYRSDDLRDVVRTASTDASGNYDLGGLDGGSYVLCAGGMSAGPYLSHCWRDAPDKNSAAPIVVGAGATIAHTDFALVRGGVLAGAVRIDDAGVPGGKPATDGYVDVYRLDDQGVSWEVGRGAIGSDGTFRIVGLPEGALTVRFSGSAFVSEYWKDAADQDHATPVSIPLGTTTTLDVSVDRKPPPPVGTVTGRVLTWQGTPVPAATVNVGQYSTTTGTDGTYSFSVPSGMYGVYFTAPGYLPANYEPDGDPANHIVNVTTGNTITGVDATLYPVSDASGTLSDPAGSPVPSFAVWAMRRDDDGHWNTVGSATGRSDGTWHVTNLMGGTYTFIFLPGAGQGLATTYLGGGHTLDGAQTTEVPIGGSLEGVAGVVDRSGRIHGTLTSAGAQLGARPISVTQVAPRDWLNDLTPDITTHENGTYSIERLVPGRYRLTYYCDSPILFPLPGQPPRLSAVPVAATRTVTVGSGEDVLEDVDESSCSLSALRKPATRGAARVGHTLTLAVGSYRPSSVHTTVTWYRGAKSTGVHKTAYRLTKKDRGKRISAHVRVTRPGYRPSTYVTKKTAKIKKKHH